MGAKIYYKREDVWPPESINRIQCTDSKYNEYWKLYDEIEKKQLPYFVGNLDGSWYVFEYDRKSNLISIINDSYGKNIENIIDRFISINTWYHTEYTYNENIYKILKRYIDNFHNTDKNVKTGLHNIIFELIMHIINYHLGNLYETSIYDFPAFAALQVLHSFGVYKLGNHLADKILPDEYIDELEEISKAGKMPLLSIAMPIYRNLNKYFKDHDYFQDKIKEFEEYPYTATLGKEITGIIKILKDYYNDVDNFGWSSKVKDKAAEAEFIKEKKRTPLNKYGHYYYED